MFQRTVLVGALSPQKSGYFWKLGSLDDATNNHTSESCGTRGRRRKLYYTIREREKTKKVRLEEREREREKIIGRIAGQCADRGD